MMDMKTGINENMDNFEEIQTMLKQKADFFYKNNIPIHCSYKNRRWARGRIVELSADFFILDELKEGKIIIFFRELSNINKMNTPNKFLEEKKGATENKKRGSDGNRNT